MNRTSYNGLTGETLYLDNLSFSQKAPVDAPRTPAPDSADDAADVLAVFSDQYDDIAGDLYGLAGYTNGDYGYGLEGFDPLAQWSLYGNVDGAPADAGSQHRYADIGGKMVNVYQNVDFIGMTFNRDPAYDTFLPAQMLDASGMETLKLSVWRTDGEAQLKLQLRYQDYDDTADEWGGIVHHTTGAVYFDTNTDNANGPVDAGQWVTLEIPLSDFTVANPDYVEGSSDPATEFVPVDASRISGLQIVSQNWVPKTADDGVTLLDENDAPVTDGTEPALVAEASRETIYIDEIFFAKTPDAPRSLIEETPAHATADVVGVFSDEYSSAFNMDGSFTVGTLSYSTFGTDTVAKYSDVSGIHIDGATTGDLVPQKLHLDLWRQVTEGDSADDADLMIRLFEDVPPPYGGPYFDVIVPAADIPANEWVRLELPVDTSVAGGSNFAITNITMTPAVAGSWGAQGGFDIPTPVETQSIYIDNLYFSNGNPAPEQPEPPFVAPSGIAIGFSAEELQDIAIAEFNGTATVERSPNGDDALKFVKTEGAGAFESSLVVSYPDAEGKMSFVSADQQAIVVSIYAPAAGETVRMKLESSADSENVYIETDAVTKSAGWQEVRFDFADLADTSPRSTWPLSTTRSSCSRASAAPALARPISWMTSVSWTRSRTRCRPSRPRP